MNINDILGYIGSLIIIISFLYSDLKKIRYINLVGCIIFVIYGFFIHQYPIVITNIFIVLVQIYHLFLKKSN